MKKQNNKLPRFLKGYFWSTDFNMLDYQKDKVYVIHQILSLGDLEAIKWLFRTYGRQGVQDSFLKKPAKIYQPKTYNWVKNILLDLKNKSLNLNRYVINTPRIID